MAQTGTAYSYAGDSPTGNIDPTGLHWWNTVWNVVTTPTRLASEGIGWAWYQTGLAGDAQNAADFWANLATGGCSSWAEQLAGNVFGPLAELGTRGNIGATVLTLGGGLAGGAAAGGAEDTALNITEHGAQQLAARGVSDADALDAYNNPLDTGPVKYDSFGRPSQLQVGSRATVAVNPETGEIITGWPTSSKLAARLGGG